PFVSVDRIATPLSTSSSSLSSSAAVAAVVAAEAAEAAAWWDDLGHVEMAVDNANAPLPGAAASLGEALDLQRPAYNSLQAQCDKLPTPPPINGDKLRTPPPIDRTQTRTPTLAAQSPPLKRPVRSTRDANVSYREAPLGPLRMGSTTSEGESTSEDSDSGGVESFRPPPKVRSLGSDSLPAAMSALGSVTCVVPVDLARERLHDFASVDNVWATGNAAQLKVLLWHA
ncbi:hypothetical protein JCM3770_002850, partial [Rhodotorula araucariae]